MRGPFRAATDATSVKMMNIRSIIYADYCALALVGWLIVLPQIFTHTLSLIRYCGFTIEITEYPGVI